MNDKLTTLLARVFDMRPKDIHATLQKEDVAKWDSLTHMDLITSIEQEYDIELSMDDILAMTSVNSILVILQTHGITADA